MKPVLGDCVQKVPGWWQTLARGLAEHHGQTPPSALERVARQLLEVLAFLRLTELGGHRLALPETGALARWLEQLRARLGPAWFEVAPGEAPEWAQFTISPKAMMRVVDQVWETPAGDGAGTAPYEWLGQIHQCLLGHRLVPRAGTLQAEASAAARKHAGIFYTPTVVARYIVQTALGATLQEWKASGRSPYQLRVLDPACGCGAFLAETLRQLGQEASSFAKLYGVDLDPEAVLICRRGLALQHAGIATPETAEQLSRTISSGDVLQGLPQGNVAPFDLILGNPPYRRELHTKHLLDTVSETEWGRRYRAPRMDYWYYFLHRGLELLRPGGRLAFIVGAYWTSGSGAHKLIAELQRSTQIEEIALLGDLPVFEGVIGRHLILTLTKAVPTRSTRIKRPVGAVADLQALLEGQGTWEVFEKAPPQLFRAGRIDLEPPADDLLAKLARGTPLGELGLVRQGIAENPASINRRTNERFDRRWTIGEGVFALTPSELTELSLSESERSLIRPYFQLSDLGRYELAERPSRHLIYATGQSWPRLEQFPALAAHLARFRPIMEERRETRQGRRAWWQLHWPREATLWETAKILSVQMGARPAFVPALAAAYVPFSVNVFVPAAAVREHLYYLTALLNSRLLWKWYQHHAKRRGIGLEINAAILAQTPIRRIDFEQAEDAERHDRIVALVSELLEDRHLRRAAEPPPTLGTRDEALDQIVYELYGLSAAEIALVERGTAARQLR